MILREDTNDIAGLTFAHGKVHALGALPPATFRLTKAQIRQPARERWESSRARIDAQVAEIWAEAPAREAIRGYVERTLGKRN
ncbi:MAG: hypothetical protein HYV93_03935 [Candidatus Rokubacteria bacterium]|nr:hypothetical protein [Candidatus Rokubacteria bacterium]